MKSNKRWLYEGKDHIRGKGIIKAAVKKYGASTVEEERFSVDLHDIEPALWPKKSIRGYQADLLVTKRRGKTLYQVIAEVDGLYHAERSAEDTLRDKAIALKYGLQVIRFDKAVLLSGKISDEEIAKRLGLI